MNHTFHQQSVVGRESLSFRVRAVWERVTTLAAGSLHDRPARPTISLVVGVICYLAGLAPATHAETTYAVVVSAATYADRDWKAVADALVAKHTGSLIRYDDLQNALPQLQALLPDYIGFVARPEEAHRQFVAQVHRLTRELDGDPYTDALWGIITGYEAADALRMVHAKEPLTIRRAMSSMGPDSLNRMEGGFASSETDASKFWRKHAGKLAEIKAAPDAAASLAESFNNGETDLVVTSGHATERHWEIGFTVRNGEFRHDNGQLLARTTDKRRVNITSPNTKVYIGAGNCLIGHIDRRDCMATAWIHTGGVNQMVGYTVVTFHGFGGWGVLRYFDSGRHTLAESFYLNTQALLHRLETKYRANARDPIADYDHRRANATLARYAENGELAGLLWDRDTVAFYGDPAWSVRMPASESSWEHTLTFTNGHGRFEIATTRAGQWGDRPVIALLPVRLRNITITNGTNHNPVVTDNFILLPLTGAFTAGERIVVEFTGQPLVRPVPPAKDKRQAALDSLRANMPAMDRDRPPTPLRVTYWPGQAEHEERKTPCGSGLAPPTFWDKPVGRASSRGGA